MLFINTLFKARPYCAKELQIFVNLCKFLQINPIVTSFSHNTSSQFYKAQHFGRVAPAIFNHATEKENANLLSTCSLYRTIWKVWCHGRRVGVAGNSRSVSMSVFMYQAKRT